MLIDTFKLGQLDLLRVVALDQIPVGFALAPDLGLLYLFSRYNCFLLSLFILFASQL